MLTLASKSKKAKKRWAPANEHTIVRLSVQMEFDTI